MLTQLTLSIPQRLTGYAWRPMRHEDVPGVHQLLLTADRADGLTMAGMLEDAYTSFADPWCDPEVDSLLGLTPAGEVAAMARVFVNPSPRDEENAYLWGVVHPDHRCRGLGEFILSWMESRGRERLSARPAGLPRSLRTDSADGLHDRLALFERHGFRPVRYSNRMRRDLHQPIPEVTLPAGIELRRFSPELSRPFLAAFNEAFLDHWNFESVSDEDWELFFMGRSTFRPDLTLLAMDGSEIAGFSFVTISPEENARHEIAEGWIGPLGVRRPWRKRGIASALLCTTMRAFRAEGLDFATLGVDTQNPSGALRLYQRLGFVAVKRFIQFSKEIVCTFGK